MSERLDVRRFPYMPLSMDDLRRSKGWTPRIGFYLVNLWMHSFHEVPAGSVEDDDEVMCHFAMCAWRDWPDVRDDIRVCAEFRDGRAFFPEVTRIAEAIQQCRVSSALRILAFPPDIRRLSSGEWKAARKRIFARDNWTCRYCASVGGRLECDHVVPVSRGGSNEDANLVTACRTCNQAKGAHLVSEWLQ